LAEILGVSDLAPGVPVPGTALALEGCMQQRQVILLGVTLCALALSCVDPPEEPSRADGAAADQAAPFFKRFDRDAMLAEKPDACLRFESDEITRTVLPEGWTKTTPDRLVLELCKHSDGRQSSATRAALLPSAGPSIAASGLVAFSQLPGDLFQDGGSLDFDKELSRTVTVHAHYSQHDHRLTFSSEERKVAIITVKPVRAWVPPHLRPDPSDYGTHEVSTGETIIRTLELDFDETMTVLRSVRYEHVSKQKRPFWFDAETPLARLSLTRWKEMGKPERQP
jgi:hypothetical protein